MVRGVEVGVVLEMTGLGLKLAVSVLLLLLFCSPFLGSFNGLQVMISMRRGRFLSVFVV